MLKAKLLQDGLPITFPDNPSRSLDLTAVISRVYTNKTQPLRLNLEKIIELRNTGTHYVTEDYETIYAPFFQANVLSFCEQIRRFHDVDVSKHISQNFLTLSINPKTLTNEEIEAKYTAEMAIKLIQARDDAEYLVSSSNSSDLYIPIRTHMYITKDPKKADFLVAVNSSSDNKVQIVKQVQNPDETHKLSFKNVIDAVNKQIIARSISFNFRNSKGECDFNKYCLQAIIKFHNIKDDRRYAFALLLSESSKAPAL